MTWRFVSAVFCLAALSQAQPAPQAAELRYVVILTRHGVRSPTWSPQRLNEYSGAAWPDWGAPPGNLTRHGRALMKLMGAYYRERFVSGRLLGTADCADAKRVYLRADNDQRTIETAKAFAEELLPGCGAGVHSLPEEESDALFNPISAGVATQDPQLAKAAVAGRIGPRLDALIQANRPAFELLNDVLKSDGKPARSILGQPVTLTAGADGVAMSGPLATASTLTEDLLLEFTNGMSGHDFGWGRMTPDRLQQVMTLHTAYADLMRRTPYLARARGSNLLSHIVRSMEQAVSGTAVKGALGEPATRLLVISGHDTNISNLSGMLGLSWLLPGFQRDDAPPGGALIFSLWHSGATGKYSVQLQFVSQTPDQMHDATLLTLANPPATADVFVPGCGTAATGYACDWSSFDKVVNGVIGAEFVEKTQQH